MTTHHVKSWSHFFDAIKRGDKRHDPFAGCYTGEEHVVEVSFITSQQYPCAYSSAVLPKDYVILSLKEKAT